MLDIGGLGIPRVFERGDTGLFCVTSATSFSGGGRPNFFLLGGVLSVTGLSLCVIGGPGGGGGTLVGGMSGETGVRQ